MKKLLKLSVIAFVLVLTACSPKVEPITTNYVSDEGTVRLNADGAMKLDDEKLAPVTIDMFFDPTCGACAYYADHTDDVVEKNIKAGDVEVVYHPVGFLNDQTIDDYSNRAGAYVLAVAEYAPAKAYDFIKIVNSTQFQPADPVNKETPDSKFLDAMKEIGLTEEQIAEVEENKGAFVSLIVASTKEFVAENSKWAKLTEEGFVYTPFVLINKTGQLTNPALQITSADDLAVSLDEAIAKVLKTTQE